MPHINNHQEQINARLFQSGGDMANLPCCGTPRECHMGISEQNRGSIKANDNNLTRKAWLGASLLISLLCKASSSHLPGETTTKVFENETKLTEAAPQGQGSLLSLGTHTTAWQLQPLTPALPNQPLLPEPRLFCLGLLTRTGIISERLQ